MTKNVDWDKLSRLSEAQTKGYAWVYEKFPCPMCDELCGPVSRDHAQCGLWQHLLRDHSHWIHESMPGFPTEVVTHDPGGPEEILERRRYCFCGARKKSLPVEQMFQVWWLYDHWMNLSEEEQAEHRLHLLMVL